MLLEVFQRAEAERGEGADGENRGSEGVECQRGDPFYKLAACASKGKQASK